MNKRSYGCLAVALFVLLLGSVICNFALLAFKAGSFKVQSKHFALDEAKELPRFDEETVQEGSGSGKIALITLRGLIASSIAGSVGESMVDDLKIQLHQAAADSEVKAIVLYVDSPGGEVTASDVIYNAVLKAREKKPVVVYMGSLAASGGFYVSCAGNYLMANDTTFTGSIGVIMETLNYQALEDKVGIYQVVFKSGKFKDMLSGSRPMTDEEKAYVQALIMQTYGKFVGIVAKERKLPEEELRNGIADGRVISGTDALKDKLIDGLGQEEDAFDKARSLASAPGASVVRYKEGFRLGKIFRLFGKSESTAKVEVQLPGAAAVRLEAGRLYLLPSFYAQ